MAAFWTGVEVVVAGYQHIAFWGDKLAPAAGGAAVVARGRGDGHGLLQLKTFNDQSLCFQLFRIQGRCQFQQVRFGSTGK